MSSLPFSVDILAKAPALASFVAGKLGNLNMDALTGVVKSVPEWNLLLDNLNSQISLRQFELAELSAQRPSTRSLKNKGSTESLLRPKNLDETPIEEGDTNGNWSSSAELPPLTRDTVLPAGPSIGRPPSTKMMPPLVQHSSSPGPVASQRHIPDRLSAPIFAAKPSSPTAFRKRKTESLISADAQTPKYRTRSMIIVYYDSQVQLAFEELVKLISAARNAMRKGKMAARMADMRRLAELETAEEELEDQRIAAESERNGQTNGNGHVIAACKGGPEVDLDDNTYSMPKLRFVSTRRMGPSRGALMMGQRTLKDTLTAGGEHITPSSVSIFDELDVGLEWCQGMCEHSAHQFLRDGDCSVEISNIKRRLTEVKEAAEREIAKSGIEDVERPEIEGSENAKPEPSRMLKPPQMRKPIDPAKKLEVDDNLDLDDEGFEDEPPKLKWRSTRSRHL